MRLKEYIDLHQHIDGSITCEIAKQLARLQGITLPTSDDDELRRLLTVSEDCRDLNEFLQCFALPVSLMQTAEGISEAVRLVLEDCKAAGDIYVELRFAPQLHTERGLTQQVVVEAAQAGMQQGMYGGPAPGAPGDPSTGAPQTSKPSIRANLILCCMRGATNQAANLETLELAHRYLVEDGGVVAIDLAGAEALWPTENYEELFARARKLGVPFTIHAGEADGPKSIQAALDYGARRIGHGVRILEDQSVMAAAKARGLYLEMCPTSNAQTCAVTDMAKYPLLDYLEYGLKVTLNTDDPAIEGTDIVKEYDFIRNNFKLNEAQERQLVANAIDAAFTSEAVRTELRTALGLAL